MLMVFSFLVFSLCVIVHLWLRPKGATCQVPHYWKFLHVVLGASPLRLPFEAMAADPDEADRDFIAQHGRRFAVHFE